MESEDGARNLDFGIARNERSAASYLRARTLGISRLFGTRLPVA